MTTEEVSNQIKNEKLKCQSKIDTIIQQFLISKLTERPVLSFANYDEYADYYFCKCELLKIGKFESSVKVINPNGRDLDGYRHGEIVKAPNYKIYESIVRENTAICLF
ncbi:MAG: hypothetical protein AAF620_01280 [Bacteroidota bacterium]